MLLSQKKYILFLIMSSVLMYLSFILYKHTSIDKQLELIDQLKKEINPILLQHLDTSRQDLSLKIFPLPHIFISKFTIPEKLSLTNINIYISLFSILLKKPKISKINIKNLYLFNVNDFDFINHGILIKKLVEKKILNYNFYIDKIYINNISNNLINTFRIDKSFINNVITMKINNNKINIFLKQKEEVITLLTKSSGNSYKFTIKEKIANDGTIQSGSGEVFIQNIQSFLSETLSNKLYTKEAVKQPINIKFNLLDNEKFLNIYNIQISSNILLGNGQILLTYNKEPSQIKLNLNTLNLSYLLDSENLNDCKFNLKNKNLNLKIDVLIKNLILKNENITNFYFLGKSKNNIFEISQCTGNLSSEGSFVFLGNIEQNNYRSVLEGVFTLEHVNSNKFFNNLGISDKLSNNNLKIKSNIRISDIDFELYDMSLNIGKTNIYGKTTAKFIGKIPRINAILQINKFNLSENNLPFLSSIISSIRNFIPNDSKILPFNVIRNIQYIGNFDLSFENLFVNNEQKINKINLAILLSNNQINVKYLTINNNNNYLIINGKLLTDNIKPTIYLNILDGNLEINENTLKVIPNLDTLLLILENNSNEFFLSSNINLKKINFLNKIQLEKSTLSIVNNNKTISLNANLDSEKLKINGNISVSPIKINLGYAFNLIALSKLTHVSPFFPENGIISINGIFTTTGNNIKELIDNIQSKGASIGRNIILNINPDIFIKTINITNYNLNNLETDKQLIFSNKGILDSYETNYVFKNNILSIQEGKFFTELSSNACSAILNFNTNNINAVILSSFYLLNKNSSSQQIVEVQTNIENTFNLPKIVINTDSIKNFFKK